MKKKFFFVSLLCLLSSWLFAIGDYKYSKFTDFSGGLNSYFSSLVIADNEVKDCRNVFFDKTGIVEKRNGFSLYASTTGVAFNNSIAYRDSSNTDWLIVISTDKIRASSNNGVFSVVIATVPGFSTSLVGAVNAFGNVYFVDNVQGVYYWNGTSTVYINGSPLGQFITEFHGRLWVAGFATPNQNQVQSSEYLNGSNWTIGPLATDPVLISIGLNDNFDGITGFFSGYNDTLYIFKNLSVNALYGFDQTDFQVRILTRDAGCVDGQSIQPFGGNLVFLSQRGIELFDGTSCTLISKKIKNFIDSATSSSFNSANNIQTSQSDWGAATLNSSTFIDTITVPGNLQLTYPDYFNSFRNGSSGTKGVWTSYCFSPLFTCTTTTVVSNGNLVITNGGQAIVNTSGAALGSGTTFYVLVSSLTPSIISGRNLFRLVLSNAKTTTADPAQSTYMQFVFKSSTTGAFYLDEVDASGGLTNCISGVTCGQGGGGKDIPLGTPAFIYLTPSSYSVTLGSYFKAGTNPSGNINSFFYLTFSTNSSSAGSAYVDAFGLAPISVSIASFLPPNATSQLLTIGSGITSWGPVTIDDTHDGGTIFYKFGSTSTASLSAITNYTSIVNNGFPTVPVNSYAAFQASFTVTNASSTVSLNSFKTTWNVGTRKPRAASVYFDDRYWLSITTGTNDTYNTATFILAKGVNGNLVWTVFDINAGTWVIYKNQLYHGNSNGNGKFYLDNQGYNDDGNVISAYVVTKDYSLDNLIENKIFDSIWLQAEGLGSYDLSASYFLDKVSTEYSLSSAVQNEQTGMLNLRVPFPQDDSHQIFGRTISFKFSNSRLEEPLSLLGCVLQYHGRPLTSE